MHFKPKALHVNQKEEQGEDSQQGHIARSPACIGRPIVFFITHRPRCHILTRQNDAVHRMQKNGGVEKVADYFNGREARHECSIGIKVFCSAEHDGEVAYQVNHQKRD